jgi:nucleotide-binding universal stress UspA family protein
MLAGIKSILVALSEEGRDEPGMALPYALSLARLADAHLTVQAAAARYAIPYSMLNDFGRNLISAENRRIAELAGQIAVKAREEAAFAGIPCAVESPQLSYASLRQRFLAYARVHDFAVVDAETHALDIDRGLIEAALFESGRPLLIVPPGHAAFDGKHILIGWDGSTGAARAVADALPFLQAAEAVEVLCIVGEKDLSNTLPGVDLAAHLARHGVRVSVTTSCEGKNRDVDDIIRDTALALGSGLIVCGAYKRSRLSEWVLGGVTDSLLRSCPLPLLMAH